MISRQSPSTSSSGHKKEDKQTEALVYASKLFMMGAMDNQMFREVTKNIKTGHRVTELPAVNVVINKHTTTSQLGKAHTLQTRPATSMNPETRRRRTKRYEQRAIEVTKDKLQNNGAYVDAYLSIVSTSKTWTAQYPIYAKVVAASEHLMKYNHTL